MSARRTPPPYRLPRAVRSYIPQAANQSARFLNAAQQPGAPQAEVVAAVLLAAADKVPRRARAV
jgi:hypothetical protein